MSSSIRARWAAIGAAIAVTIGAGGYGLTQAALSSGERAVFVPITPCRIADTRAGTNNVGPRSTPINAGENYTISSWGENGDCNLPADATALALNVTAVGATQQTNLRIYPTGAALPTTSNLNPTPGSPPIPNAVTTDVNAAGKFTVYNAAGTVNVVIDVNGYFADHNHDDRYYTKGQINSASKWISIDPLAVNVRGSTNVRYGAGAAAGLALPASGPFPSFEFGFTVPPDQTANTTMTIQIAWHTSNTNCFMGLFGNFSSVGRPGAGIRADALGAATSTAPAAANTVATTNFLVNANGFGLRPADTVLVGFFRPYSVPSDTCSGDMLIDGIRVLYS